MRSVLPLPLKNLNYLQAKAGGAETRKFPPIPQIGGFRCRLETSLFIDNRPFPSSCLLPLQSESKCEVFVMKIGFHSYVK